MGFYPFFHPFMDYIHQRCFVLYFTMNIHFPGKKEVWLVWTIMAIHLDVFSSLQVNVLNSPTKLWDHSYYVNIQVFYCIC